ncbi:hypothetical protein D3C81_840910 [compost metagenome]|uniref:Lipoprotein n=2 Tax=Cupriavidus campinensis TaxID=151783 RepID=A0ABY3EMJ9_9BURK|nr:hypothetical protein [Cupriavidus campinensis]TSP12179.1 hypothetical protein FGG12_14300 [Cupriavidus campinensis]CAG2129336.1 hypothetical protein LMG19282_00162 [Cupriavidus campinensis]
MTRYFTDTQTMKPILFASLAALAVLAGCSAPDAPNEANFRAALEKQLEAHGDLCIGRHRWPVDVPDLPVAGTLRDGIQMPALEHAGLVAHTRAEMTLRHQNGETETVKALRYDLTDKGRGFVNAHPKTAAKGADTAEPDLCYGHVRVNKVTGWDTPKASGSGSDDKPAHATATVRYTYMLDPAPWASDAAVQGAFPVLARVVRGSGTMALTQQLVATSGGWQPMQ